MSEVHFVVEEAGCESCAARIRGALEHVAPVVAIAIDESADAADVRLGGNASRDEVATALAAASEGAGHTYRIREGSWEPSAA